MDMEQKEKIRNDGRINPANNIPGSNLGNFEDLLQLINPLGRWQMWIWTMVGFMQFWGAMINLSVVFYGIEPNFYCQLPQETATNWSFANVRSLRSPLTDEKKPDGCKARVGIDYGPILATSNASVALSELNQTLPGGLQGLNSTDCDRFLFDNSQNMRLTIVNQWGLVCERKFLVEHSQLVYMAGYLFGSFVSGQISDFMGRKTAFVVFGTLMGVFGSAQGFAPNYAVFLVLRFFVACTNIAATMASFCLALEVTTTKYRIWVGGLFFLPYAFGYTFLALVAFIIRDWRYVQLAVSLPTLLCIAFIWLLPESPRWLLVKRKTKRAKETIEWAARRNKISLPASLDYDLLARRITEEVRSEKKKTAHCFMIFKHRVLGFRAINLYFNWFVNAAVYYGVSLNVSRFQGNVFANNAIAGAVEIPAYCICVPLLYWGRRSSLFATLLLAGASLIVIPWIPKNPYWLKIMLAMIGKFGITASFAIVYVFTLELYPTVVRNAGVSSSSCIARFGSMLAPYIAGISKLGEQYEWITMTVFGVISLTAAALTLLLPETKGKKLPDHFNDAIHLQDEVKKSVMVTVPAPISTLSAPQFSQTKV